MDKNKIEQFMMVNKDLFPSSKLFTIREALESMDEDKFFMVQSINYKSPTMILLLAILLMPISLDRFLLDDVGLGIARMLTCQGLLVWGVVDACTAIDRTKEYNYKKFAEVAGAYY